MKPLTIDELKALAVGDWVLVQYADGEEELAIIKMCGDFTVGMQKSLSFKYSYCPMDNIPNRNMQVLRVNKEQAEVEEYKIDFDEQGGWEVRKYIPAHYQPWFTADTREQAEARLKELQGE